MDDNHLRVVLKLPKRSSQNESTSGSAPKGKPPSHSSIPRASKKRTKAISEDPSFIRQSPPASSSKEAGAQPLLKRRKQLSNSEDSEVVEAPSFKKSGHQLNTNDLTNTSASFSTSQLLHIIDQLQKKDLYGVFSVPVDPKEVPDYYDVIKKPMDFGTVRTRTFEGLYHSWEQFEDDLALIWTNAMFYNGEGTVYFKQAKAIQSLAAKLISQIKFPGGVDSAHPRIGPGRPGRGRGRGRGLPGRPRKLGNTGPELMTGARKPAALGREVSFGVSGPSASQGRSFQEPTDGVNKIAKGERMNDAGFMGDKDIKKQEHLLKGGNRVVDLHEPAARVPSHPKPVIRPGEDNKAARLKGLKVCRRATSPSGGKHKSFRSWRHSKVPPPSCCWDADNIQVMDNLGLFLPEALDSLAYAESLSRFTAPLGPRIWKKASCKVQETLPSGIPFGCGWIGEPEGVESYPEAGCKTVEKQFSALWPVLKEIKTPVGTGIQSSFCAATSKVTSAAAAAAPNKSVAPGPQEPDFKDASKGQLTRQATAQCHSSRLPSDPGLLCSATSPCLSAKVEDGSVLQAGGVNISVMQSLIKRNPEVLQAHQLSSSSISMTASVVAASNRARQAQGQPGSYLPNRLDVSEEDVTVRTLQSSAGFAGSPPFVRPGSAAATAASSKSGGGLNNQNEPVLRVQGSVATTSPDATSKSVSQSAAEQAVQLLKSNPLWSVLGSSQASLASFTSPPPQAGRAPSCSETASGSPGKPSVSGIRSHGGASIGDPSQAAVSKGSPGALWLAGLSAAQFSAAALAGRGSSFGRPPPSPPPSTLNTPVHFSSIGQQQQQQHTVGSPPLANRCRASPTKKTGMGPLAAAALNSPSLPGVTGRTDAAMSVGAQLEIQQKQWRQQQQQAELNQRQRHLLVLQQQQKQHLQLQQQQEQHQQHQQQHELQHGQQQQQLLQQQQLQQKQQLGQHLQQQQQQQQKLTHHHQQQVSLLMLQRQQQQKHLQQQQQQPPPQQQKLPNGEQNHNQGSQLNEMPPMLNSWPLQQHQQAFHLLAQAQKSKLEQQLQRQQQALQKQQPQHGQAQPHSSAKPSQADQSGLAGVEQQSSALHTMPPRITSSDPQKQLGSHSQGGSGSVLAHVNGSTQLVNTLPAGVSGGAWCLASNLQETIPQIGAGDLKKASHEPELRLQL